MGTKAHMFGFLTLLAMLVLAATFALGNPYLVLRFGDRRYEDLVDEVRKRLKDLETENEARVHEAVRKAKKGLVKEVLKDSVLQSSTLQSIQREMLRVKKSLELCGHPKVAEIFARTYMNAISTTVELANTGHTFGIKFVTTGDNNAWIRDSACQLHPYIPLARDDPHVQLLMEGVIKQQMAFLQSSPLANALRIKWQANPPAYDTGLAALAGVGYLYELDSLAYFLRFSYEYWQHSGVHEGVFDNGDWFYTVDIIVQQMIMEQHHEDSTFRYEDWPRNALSSPVGYTGMTWTGYRPNDDHCRYHYLIPANALAHVELGHVLEMMQQLLDNLGVPREEVLTLQHRIAALRLDIDSGIHKYGLADHPKFGKIYAYEVDGLGGQILMDDANVPSLLSLKYLNYTTLYDPSGQIFQNTWRFVLSKDNPNYFEGASLTGVGSSVHNQPSRVWPMSVIIQAMTVSDKAETMRLVEMLVDSDDMHESVDPLTPHFYSNTPQHFGRANALFAELVIQHLPDICSAPAFGSEEQPFFLEKTDS